MTHFSDTFATPFGLFSIATDENGALVASAFGPQASLRARFQTSELTTNVAAGRTVRQQILEYCSGERREFTVTLAAHGTEFQQRVWSALRTIPYGETRSYGQLAAQLGNSNASRAVGRANATNPICLVVPCHRVIGASGSLTGFAFGDAIKRQLLHHEKALPATRSGSHAA